MDERLTPRERIKRRKDFYNLYKRGKRIKSKYFTLVFAPNNIGFPRLGISVNKSIGNSVKRNKVKRWFRELFRRNKQLFTIPLDVIFLPRKEILETNWHELQSEYKKLITSICLKIRK